MALSKLLDYALVKPEVEESLPFGPDALKTNGKMFLLIAQEVDPLRFNTKCDPDRAAQLQEKYTSILPSYQMNKKYWNAVLLDGLLPGVLVQHLIDHSYELIRATSQRPTSYTKPTSKRRK